MVFAFAQQLAVANGATLSNELHLHHVHTVIATWLNHLYFSCDIPIHTVYTATLILVNYHDHIEIVHSFKQKQKLQYKYALNLKHIEFIKPVIVLFPLSFSVSIQAHSKLARYCLQLHTESIFKIYAYIYFELRCQHSAMCI